MKKICVNIVPMSVDRSVDFWYITRTLTAYPFIMRKFLLIFIKIKHRGPPVRIMPRHKPEDKVTDYWPFQNLTRKGSIYNHNFNHSCNHHRRRHLVYHRFEQQRHKFPIRKTTNQWKEQFHKWICFQLLAQCHQCYLKIINDFFIQVGFMGFCNLLSPIPAIPPEA